MFHKILTSSRYVIVIAVAGSFLASLASLVYGGVKSVVVVVELLQQGLSDEAAKGVAVSFIELIDLFLIGTVFYIISLGLYELFIDDALELPAWLVIHNLDDLEGKLISGVVVIMVVYFLGLLVESKGQTDLLQPGLSIALVITALTFFQFLHARKHNSN
jgi:uncharacterized membrane protein YqhA